MSGLEEPRRPAEAEAFEANLVLGVALMKPRVLICSLDAEFYLFLSHILEVDGFVSEPAGGAKEALAKADEREVQAVVLDCGPTSLTGSAICARLKREPRTVGLPVIALIAPGAENQHLDLLKAGIDESFVRPMAPAKLLDCLRSKLGLAKPGSNGVENGSWLSFGNVTMNLDARRVCGNGHDIHLGPIEFNLLRHLLETPGKVFSRDEMIGAAWPANIHVGERTVDVHISRLRRALETASTDIVIRTVRSSGYSLEKLDG
ncbi:MAG: response regulator transcription factor [Mesorhizobium sp.]|uniref:response regulator transcription factor n=1 Tax=unclassified Mesorhizobium TaxID=325217 RepID=UPI000FD8FB30|nr:MULTISPECIES: response regulator transcription factor [unclassified Mesorhizobium]TGV84138.1 response regulator transcription factor [Mesorhizobium sp. M00.F.Ca.ET.158.01.1.1]RWE22239.1 MAG: response regulator transcription factor [Mesorhizobium sp.]TGQ21353.1 response regulator transcription factor [Mesorhizobium sp. M00.F.Ca.ET.217.01.1.1]TIU85904.1 MAG: response regulator transcription factor [Mesorhizobium sp.]TKB44170.1 MAG: response regulator transcription factor [Mesorhizobium sp.]